MPGIDRLTHGLPAVLVANPTAQSGKAADWIKKTQAYADAVANDDSVKKFKREK